MSWEQQCWVVGIMSLLGYKCAAKFSRELVWNHHTVLHHIWLFSFIWNFHTNKKKCFTRDNTWVQNKRLKPIKKEFLAPVVQTVLPNFNYCTVYATSLPNTTLVCFPELDKVFFSLFSPRYLKKFNDETGWINSLKPKSFYFGGILGI